MNWYKCPECGEERSHKEFMTDRCGYCVYLVRSRLAIAKKALEEILLLPHEEGYWSSTQEKVRKALKELEE